MKSNIIKLFMFAAGAAIGSAVTWKIVKTKYERLTQEEIESVREYYADKYKPEKHEDSTGEEAEDEPNEVGRNWRDTLMYEYTEQVNKYKGDDYISPAEAVKLIRPYIIDADEFGEIEDYERITCYYYKDGVLATEYDEPIGNIDDVIGLEALDHFGDFAENTVFVRNDRLRADYEVLRSAQTYAEIENDENEYC